ncbi:MAG: hypothetical protein HRT92_04780 [Piscirickettsiaceae bacterium]|nr:hypothetical protein [Piscirickettsiaceae bacterium]
MNRLLITLLLTFLLSNIAWAKQASQLIETNSLSKAAIEISALNAPSPTNTELATPYTHASEKNNSLFRAVLAIHESQIRFRFSSDSKVRDSRSRYTSKNEQNNSLAHGAIWQHQKNIIHENKRP